MMKLNDKIIVMFLVSAGVFSAAVAADYVKGLSVAQKNSLVPAAKKYHKNMLLCEGTESVKFAENKA